MAASMGASVAVVVAVAPATARAFERQHHLGVDLGVGVLAVKDKPAASVGPAVGAHYAYGITDQFLLYGEGSYARVALEERPEPTGPTPANRPTDVWAAGVGAGYVLDVLQWVPYFGATAGVHGLHGGTLPSAVLVPSVDVALGLDYQLSRSFAVGVAFRQAFLLTEMTNYPSYTKLFARVELLWGF
jgi:hypothetical protein